MHCPDSPGSDDFVNIGGWPSGRLLLAYNEAGHSAPAGGTQWPGQS